MRQDPRRGGWRQLLAKLKCREAFRVVSVSARQAFRNFQATEARLDAIQSEIEASRSDKRHCQ